MEKKWFETHLTVIVGNLSVDQFITLSDEIGVKPIVIDLYKNKETVIQRDVMTASKYFGVDREVMKLARELKDRYESAGFQVVRTKIESEPTYYLAPQELNDLMPENSYFEAHVSFLCDKQKELLLHRVARKNNTRISRNPFKIIDNKKVIMATMRDYKSPFCVFNKNLQSFISEAEVKNLIPLKKIEVEFAVYDSNWLHDNHWVS